mgnify:CR=1 FL=1
MRKGLLLLVLPLWLAGCVATQRDVLEVQTQMDDLSEKISSLQKDINSLQKNQADLASKMDELNGSMGSLNENLKDSRSKMTQLGSKIDDMQAGLGQKVQTLGENFTKATAEARAEAIKAAQGAGQDAALQALKDAEAKEAAKGPSPTKVYREAYVQFVRKNFDLASQGFSVYLENYPKAEMADLATFYLGECRYAKKDYDGAAAQYASVLENYPKSDLTPSARLNYSLTLLNLKAKDPEAKRYLESIVNDFPKSSEAKTARQHLESLDGSPPKSSKPKTR